MRVAIDTDLAETAQGLAELRTEIVYGPLFDTHPATRPADKTDHEAFEE